MSEENKVNNNPQYYQEIAPLTREQHGDMCIEPLDDYSFTKGTNTVYVFGMEFIRACKEYPIVFANYEGNLFPVALLGLVPGQNVFLDQNNVWNARYIPGYVRRYPFILVDTGEGQHAICIDNKYAGLNKEGKGQRLYGENDDGPVIEEAKDFLVKFQSHIKRTEIFCKRLRELDLLVPMETVVTEEGRELSMEGLEIVDRQRVLELDDKVIIELMRNNEMELIYQHLTSLEIVSSHLLKYA